MDFIEKLVSDYLPASISDEHATFSCHDTNLTIFVDQLAKTESDKEILYGE
jgi:hypothetical protein